jgi:hypothetical protein
MGDHLGTASYDLTWRLWDIATGDCLLEQVGFCRRGFPSMQQSTNFWQCCGAAHTATQAHLAQWRAVKTIFYSTLPCRKVTPGLCTQ